MRFNNNIRMQHQRQNIELVNPYEKLYRSFEFKTGQFCTRNQAESIARHLGYLHNAFGLVVKDFINIMKYRFPNEDKYPVYVQPMVEERQQGNQEQQQIFQQMTQNIKWRQQYAVADEKIINKKKQQQIQVLPIQSNFKGFQYKNESVVQVQKQEATALKTFNPSLFEYKPQKLLGSTQQVRIQEQSVRQIKTVRKSNVINLDDSEDE